MSDFTRQPVSFPASVVFLDDSVGFLSALRSMFPDTRTHHFFARPGQALDFVMRNGYPARGARLAGRDYAAVDCGAGNAVGDDIMEDGNRFQSVAAVVVDYEMPEIDGLTFLSQMKGIDCTRVLLTGKAGAPEAVDAFNAGLIDYYLKKSDAEMIVKLRALLGEARRKHCMSRGLVSVHDTGAVYSRPETIAVLENLARRESITEYYWRPDGNAILTFDAAGEAGIFLAWDETDWALQCDVIADEGGPRELLDEMNARRTMPVFWPHQAYRPGAEIVRYAVPHPINGLPGAFYSWTRLDGDDLLARPLTFADWRLEQQLHGSDSCAVHP
ncbi:response regulator [Paraburkholderia oxyphila]|uniref:response regulator n=1 Tax=Paraburkholderia oxyphila TaxID=614212 RepID=UPI000487D4A8|nr:response regulator [Paraburkholderia oxyphila]